MFQRSLSLHVPAQIIEGVKGPWGIAVTRMGEVVVAEWNGHCVSVFSPCGEKLHSLDQLKCPRGLAVDMGGNILVAESASHQISKLMYTAKEGLIPAAMHGMENLGFPCPTDVLVTTNQYVYIADEDLNSVQVLNADLTFSHSLDVRRQGMDHRPQITGITGQNTTIYAADNRNHCIHIFKTKTGKYSKKIGKPGHRDGELELPLGIAIDSAQNVYVSEGGNHRISVFTKKGEFVTSFGRKGKRAGEFDCPSGLAVDHNVLYVCDRTAITGFKSFLVWSLLLFVSLERESANRSANRSLCANRLADPALLTTDLSEINRLSLPWSFHHTPVSHTSFYICSQQTALLTFFFCPTQGIKGWEGLRSPCLLEW